MPEMNGIEVLKTIRSIDKKARVIIITGFGDLETAVKAINNHAYAFFGKPIDFKELVETLRVIEEEIKDGIDSNIDYKRLSDEYKELKHSYDNLLDVIKKFEEGKNKNK
jgi:DNA-binding NtrC family response regulator